MSHHSHSHSHDNNHEHKHKHADNDKDHFQHQQTILSRHTNPSYYLNFNALAPEYFFVLHKKSPQSSSAIQNLYGISGQQLVQENVNFNNNNSINNSSINKYEQVCVC